MRYLRGPITNNRILVPIGIRKFSDDPSLVSDFTFHQFVALVDTGASRTCISQNVVDKVGLKGRGQIPVGNVKRTEMHDTYLFYVGFWPEIEGDQLPTVFGIGEEILGIDGGDSRFYDILLGMDIVSRGCLRVECDGSFELGFPD